MNKNIDAQTWGQIRHVVAQAQRASMHCSIASVSSEGIPNITPIGTLFLNDTSPTGFFFDTYSATLQQHLKYNAQACIQAVNSSRVFWLKSMMSGQFRTYPGVRLYAEIGELRPATAGEMHQVRRRIAPLKWSRGSKLIWSDFTQVREVHIHAFRWVEYPSMMPKTSSLF
ncbi:pyridoxamine 5'-phosphate oxidase [Acinetobacter indicus]|uniref:hypothetical protein n=1 Tax=Acinetobacter indicus TaxID=756892 RepID=UPI0005F864C3|nr:hypothetical protein [Acinetobacter indicus]KJV46247.1 pyridoxamine 5'-phosphate oxidase [Acinetobacter indicus]OUY09969.1 pyridoxamine 5'-phosphate oxidase [Acinetobacter indicus]